MIMLSSLPCLFSCHVLTCHVWHVFLSSGYNISYGNIPIVKPVLPLTHFFSMFILSSGYNISYGNISAATPERLREVTQLAQLQVRSIFIIVLLCYCVQARTTCKPKNNIIIIIVIIIIIIILLLLLLYYYYYYYCRVSWIGCRRGMIPRWANEG